MLKIYSQKWGETGSKQLLKDLSENNGRNRADLGINGMDLPGNETGRKNLESGKKAYDLLVVLPVHCNFESEINSAGNLKIKKITHHEAVGFLLKNRINVPVIEITGVKGKTSVSWMLKEIFKDLNPLILSSLGVEVIKIKGIELALKLGITLNLKLGAKPASEHMMKNRMYPWEILRRKT